MIQELEGDLGGSQMGLISRRGAAGALIAITGLVATGGLADTALAFNRVRLPDGAMRLSRRLERSLHDGVMLKVTRAWDVQFSAQGRGISISGQQVSAQVDAPPSLANLAKIEESRSTAEMWPMLLADDGRIVAVGGRASKLDIAAAVDEAQRMIASRPLAANEQEARFEYLKTVAQAGVSLLEELPEDLFFPTARDSRLVKELRLPNGMSGEFEASYEAKVGEEGWLDHAKREISTRIDGSVQRTIETWTLARI